MKERLIELVKKLNGMRDDVIGFYAMELDKFTANDGNPNAALRAGILHDLDKHITNLELELKRLEALQLFKGEVNA